MAITAPGNYPSCQLRVIYRRVEKFVEKLGNQGVRYFAHLRRYRGVLKREHLLKRMCYGICPFRRSLLWNAIDNEIKLSPSLEIFKK